MEKSHPTADLELSPGLVHNLDITYKNIVEALDRLKASLVKGDMVEAKDDSHRLTASLGSAAWYQEHSDQAQGWYIEKFKDLMPPPDPAIKILYTHPGHSSYYDGTIWFPLPRMDDGSRGFWLWPGQDLAVIGLPNKYYENSHRPA